MKLDNVQLAGIAVVAAVLIFLAWKFWPFGSGLQGDAKTKLNELIAKYKALVEARKGSDSAEKRENVRKAEVAFDDAADALKKVGK